jgi:hypothetical protein
VKERGSKDVSEPVRDMLEQGSDCKAQHVNAKLLKSSENGSTSRDSDVIKDEDMKDSE